MEPPLFPTGGPQIVRAAPGTVASLVLPLPIGSPPIHYKWSRAGASLDDRFVTSDDTGGVRLTVSAARTGDSGVYTLQASNAAGKDTTRVRLEVSPDEAPVGDDPPNFLRRLQDLTVKVGTRTRFLVEIVSSTECKVTWYRNERRLMETERVALVRDGNFWCADVATVSVDDAGRWTCTAENVGGRASCSAHLNVLVPKAYKRPEFVEELRALLTEQGTVSLECKVVGVPTPVLRWFKDSREIKAGDVFALTANADDPTSLGTYTCEAVNCMGRAYSSSKVHVVGRASREGSMRPSSGGLTPDPPPIFTKELEDQFVRICEPLTLNCHIVVPPWPRSVVWYNKEGKIEPSERYHVLEDGVGGYLLEVCSAEWADEGEWKCVASTAGGRVGMSACYVSMDVPKNYRKPRFMENLQAVLTEEGLVSFECKVVGFPTPVLSWFKDGQELKPGDVYQLTGTNSLGSYCCIAKNCMGQASSSAELTVEDIQNQLNDEEKHQLFSKNQAPKFLQGLKSVEAKIDEPFRFTIKVAIPPEPSLLWYRDDQPVDESSRCHHTKEDRGVFYLDIQNLEFLDQAEWKCVAMNDFGQSVTSCFLKLIIPRHYKKPRFLENLQAILSDEGAVNLECKVIGVPQPVLKWYKDGEELKPGDIHRIISGQDGTCCLGTYTCEAQNCMGIAASSASLLGFDDSMKVKSKKKSEEQTLQRNLSLSTIHEERTSQMYDTPVGDRTLDDKGEISFSFDGKEVSVSLYETPDLTEEEALQIVEMYADQLSENVTEHNVVELPPLRFVKETSTSGNLLMEAIIIDVSPEYFASPEEDLRTEADIEDISIADENGPLQISLDQDQEMSSQDYLEKTMAMLSDEKADIPKKLLRKMSDTQRSGEDYFSLSRDHSFSGEKKDDEMHILSESDLQSFESAKSSAKLKSKSPKSSLEDPVLEVFEVTNNKLYKEDIETMTTKADVPIPKLRRRSSRSSRRSSSGSEKSLGKLKDEKDVVVEQPTRKLIADEEYTNKINTVSNSLSKILNDIQIIERDIILQSELMSSVATASKSLEIIGSLISPITEMQSVAEAAKEATFVTTEINSTLFNSLFPPLKALYQALTIIEKCIDVESDNKTLVKKTCVSLIEKCGNEIQDVVLDINTLISKKYLGVEETIVSQIESLSNEMITIIGFSTDTIKARSLLHEASEFKSEIPSLDNQHLKDTQKAIFELKTSLLSLLRIVESTAGDNLTDTSKIKGSEIILNDMSASIQYLQEALEQIESLSMKETTSSLIKYNTEIIETVMDSILKLRTSFEQLSIEAKQENNENTLKQVLTTVKLNLNEISLHIHAFENKIGKFDIIQGDNKLEVLQKMAQTLILFENSLPILDIVPDVKEHMVAFHKHLTRVLENVIESNEGAKYFAFLEICDTISRVNASIKTIESLDEFSLTSISNTLRIIQDQFIHKVFAPELNCSVLSSIEDIQINLLKNINYASEINSKVDSDNIQDLQDTKQDTFKANVVMQSIELSIAAIDNVTAEECAHELKTSLSPILKSIRPNLENLKQNIASLIAVETEREEHISELTEMSDMQTLAIPLCELNQNILVLNQTLLENVDSFRENSAIATAYAQPLHELLSMLEVLQQEIISQHGEYVSPYVVSSNIANVVDNVQSCIVLIHEQSGIETADEMSTLEDVSGIKTTAESVPLDCLVPLTTEEIYTEHLTDKLKLTQSPSVTAQTLQALNEHAVILQHPNILEFLDVLSECSDYATLKSVAIKLEKLNEGIQEVLHPLLIENTNEFSDLLNSSQLMQIAMPLQDLYHSLSVIDASNIPIYENILKMPSEKIHSAIDNLSVFKEQLETCLSNIIPGKETNVTALETLNNIGITKEICVDLNNIIHALEDTSVGLNPKVISFKNTLTSFIDCIDQKEHIDSTKVKTLVMDLNEHLLTVQDELIQCKSQPCEKIAKEIELIETVHQLESNIAILEQYEFVDSSGAYDIDSCITPQTARETQADSLKQIEDLVNQAVNIVQDFGHASQTADLIILEDFFRTCKLEFSILRCLITKRPSYKKLIRLLQEFNFLRCIIANFKKKQIELSLSEDINELLSNFIINLDISMKDIEESLVRMVNSQSKFLIEIPLKNLDDNTKKLTYLSKGNKFKNIVNFIENFLQSVKNVRPIFNNLKAAIVEELESSHIQIEKSVTDENMDMFLNYIEEELTHLNNDDEYKQIVKNVLSCLQKHQDYKDIVGQSKTLMLLKCLSECSTILKQMLNNEIEQNKQFLIESEVIVLKTILNEMIEPLQGLRSQLITVQEQITSGADEESISIDLSSTDSYVQALNEINNDVLLLLQSENTILDETDLSVIEEINKEIHTIQENIQLAENTETADVTKHIILPLDNIEKSLLLAKEKMSVENKSEIPKDINSNISSLEYFLNCFVKLETDLLEIFELSTEIDIQKCISLATEISSLLNSTEFFYDIDLAGKIKNEKMRELAHILMKFDWLNTEQFYENREAVMIDKLKRVYLSGYQLLSELNNNVTSLDGPFPIMSEDKAEALMQHIGQYIEMTERIEEVSAVIKLDDLLETANIARELRESIDEIAKSNANSVIEMDSKQNQLMHRLHKALSELQVQVLDSVFEIVPTFDDNIKQHIIEVVGLLKADLMAITGVHVALIAPETTYDDTKIIESKADNEPAKLIPEEYLETDYTESTSETRKVLDISEITTDPEIYEVTKHEKSEEIMAEVEKKSIDSLGEDSASLILKDQYNSALAEGSLTKTTTIGTLLEHISEYICDDIIAIISQVAIVKDIEGYDRSTHLAKELRDSIVALEVSPLEAVTLLSNENNVEQGQLIWHLQEALKNFMVLTLQNADEIKPLIGQEYFARVIQVVQNLHTDMNAVVGSALIVDKHKQLEAESTFETEDLGSDVRKQDNFKLSVDKAPLDSEINTPSLRKQEESATVKVEICEDDSELKILRDDDKDRTPEIENMDSIKKLECLLSEVNNQVDLYSTLQDTEFLRNILDEVQTVIIKLKRDYDGSANDTLNETLEDLECSVRSVQLQINENSAPNVLKDACTTLQLLVKNINDIKGHISHSVGDLTTDTILEKCSEEAEQTLKLIDEASKGEIGSQMINLLSKLNFLRDTLKILWTSFRGNTDNLINNGIDVNQGLNSMEEQIFSLEKDIDAASCSLDIKDSLIVAVHAVYKSISNMRSAISSIQKEFMYENYGIPSEKFLHSLKNIAILYEGDKRENWKHVGKVLRQVLNHFEDIKFYVNFDKTARIPSDAAFTKIIIDELTNDLKNVVLANVLDLYPEMSDKVREVIKNVEEYNLNMESRVSIEVKEKIPIFKNIAQLISNLTDELVQYKKEKISVADKDTYVQQMETSKQKPILVDVTEEANISELVTSYEPIEPTNLASVAVEEVESSLITAKVDMLDNTDIFVETTDIGPAYKEDEDIAEIKEKGDDSSLIFSAEKLLLKKAESSGDKCESVLQEDTLQVENIKDNALKSYIFEEQEFDQQVLTEMNKEQIDQLTEETPSCSFHSSVKSVTELSLQTEAKTLNPIKELEMEKTESEIHEQSHDEYSQEQETILSQIEVKHVHGEEDIQNKREDVKRISPTQANGRSNQTLEDEQCEGEKSEKSTEFTKEELTEKYKENMKAQIEQDQNLHDENTVLEEEKLRKGDRTQLCKELEDGEGNNVVSEKELLLITGDHDVEKILTDKNEKLTIDEENQEVRKRQLENKSQLEEMKEDAEIKTKEDEQNLQFEIKNQSDKELLSQKEEQICLESANKKADTKLTVEDITLEKEKNEVIISHNEEMQGLLKKGKEDESKEQLKELAKSEIHKDTDIIDNEQTKQSKAAVLEEKNEDNLLESVEFEKRFLNKEETDLKFSDTVETCIKKDKQKANKNERDEMVQQKKEQVVVQTETDEGIKRKKEKKLCLKEESEIKEFDDQASLKMRKEDNEIQSNEEEKRQIKKESEQYEENRLVKQDRLEKDKQEAHVKELESQTGLEDVTGIMLNEEEKLDVNKKTQKTEKLQLDVQVTLEKKNDDSEPINEEEMMQLRKEKQKQIKGQAQPENEKDDVEMKRYVEEKPYLAKEKEETEKEELDDQAGVEKDKERAEIKCNDEEKLRLVKEEKENELQLKEEKMHRSKEEKQESEKTPLEEQPIIEKVIEDANMKHSEEENLSLETEKQGTETKRKNEEMLGLKKEREDALANRVEEEKLLVGKAKENAEAKLVKEGKLCVEMDNEKAEKKQLENLASLEIENEDAVSMRMEEEILCLGKEKEDADTKCKEDEMLHQKEKQENERTQLQEQVRLQEEDAKIISEEEEVLRLEMKKQEAEQGQLEMKAREVKEVDKLLKEEEIVKLQREKQEAVKEQLEEQAKVQTEIEDNEIKRKEEILCREMKNQEAAKRQLEEEASLEKEKENAEILGKEEELLLLRKENQEIEKRQLEERAKLEKKQDDVLLKRDEEEMIEKEKQEAEKKQFEDKARLEKEIENDEMRKLEDKEILSKKIEDAKTKLKKEEMLYLEKEEQEIGNKQLEENARVKKKKEDAEIKRKEEETLRSEKEKQEAEKRQLEERARLQKEKEDAEILRKEEELLQLEKEKQEAEKRQLDDKARLEKEKEDAEIKRKEEEMLRSEKEKQETEKRQLEEKARLQKEKADAEILRKEEEMLQLEKEKQEAEKRRLDDNARLEKEKEDAEIKRKEEEMLITEKEKQETEERQLEEKARLQKEKEDADLLRKEEETLQLEKEKREAEERRLEDKDRLEKEKEDAEIKRKEDETLRSEKEKQETEKRQLEEKARLQKEKADAEILRKEEETLQLEKEKQEAEKRRLDDNARLEKEKEDAEIKRKEEEMLFTQKEKRETEERQLEEKARLQKEKEDDDLLRKEEETLQLEKEKQEVEKKQLQEKERLEKEKDIAEILHKKEEVLRQEKHKLLEAENKQLEEQEILEKKKEEAELKHKEEQNARLEEETEDTEILRKEQEILCLEKKSQNAKKKLEAKAGLEKENVEIKRKEEKILFVEEEEIEIKDKSQLQNKKKAVEVKSRKKDEKTQLEKVKQKEEETILQKEKKEQIYFQEKKQDADEKQFDGKTSSKKEEEGVETEPKKERMLGTERKSSVAERKQTEVVVTSEKEKKYAEIEIDKKEEMLLIKKEKQLHEEVNFQKEKICSEKQNQEIVKFQSDDQKIIRKPMDEKKRELTQQGESQIKLSQDIFIKSKHEKENYYETQKREDNIYKLNGSMDKYKIGEIDISSSSDPKHERKEKSYYTNYCNNTSIGLEMFTPPKYIEKRTYDSNRFLTTDIDTTRKIPTTYKAQTLLYQSQMRSSTPQHFEVARRSESIEKRSDFRHRSKALSENRSVTVEKRTSGLRDHKRRPVLSTYLTDRTAVEASRVKLTCSVLSSTDPTITWFKNGVLLDNKLKYKTKYLDGLITLEVLNAVPNDSAEYTCTIQNESGSVSTSANLKVYPSFEASPIPPTFTRSIRDTYHLAENELILESRIRGQPLPTITWLKDDRPLCDDERYQAYYLADGVCRLVITSPVTTDSGRYTCKAENSMWSDQITHVVNFTGKEICLGPNVTTIDRSRFNRHVLESRRPHFTNVLTDYKVTKGGTIGLQVEIKGSPTRVEWLREGNAVTDTHRNAQTFVDHGLYTLALSDVTEKESGLYTCRAWSGHGNVDMNAAITVVQPNELEGKPAIIVGRPEKDVLISVGEDLNISFRAQGEPKPKVLFMKGIRDITNSQRVCKMTSDDYVKFTLKRSVVSDAGTYCILVRNAYGCDRAFVTVVVRQRASSENLISDWTYTQDDISVSIAEKKYKSVPDRIPAEPSVVDGGNNWVSLAWPKPEHQESAPVLAYKVENWLIGKEGGARWRELGITPLNSFDAFNLKQGEEYHFRVTPRNRCGWGEPVQTSNAIGIGLAGDRPEFTEILPGQLKVLVGQTANLSCSFKGKPTPEIVWMKNGHEIDDDDLRINTLLNGYDCSLTINDVQIDDEARYSCEASNVHGRASTYARMAVITDKLIWEADAKLKRERSAGIEGEYPPQFTMRLRDRRVQATYPVRLTCQVIGNPPPLVIWFKDGLELSYDSRHNECKDEQFHTLEIAPTSLEDGGVYEAMARNNSGAVSCRCSLVVDKGIRAYVAPEFCCGLEPLYRLSEGEELRISAMVEAYPSVGVTWYRDGVRLRPSRRAIMTLDHDGQIELALASVTGRDAGVYTCTASNEVGQATTSGKVDVIEGDHGHEKIRTPPVVISPDVPYSKEPMFIRKPRSSEAREGDTVIIECEVIGDPKPDVYWLRDFLKPDYYRDANHFKRVGAGPEYRFEIPHAKLDYTGTYSVVARNAHGEAKAIISLQILAKDIDAVDDVHNVRYGRVDVIPRFDKELTDLLCYDGDAIEFECRVSGDPEPYIKWLHYNEVVRDSQDFETCYDEGTARLKIKQVTAEDEGTYTCEASNSLGKAKSSACLVVYPPGEPNTLSQRLRRPPALLSAASTPRSTPRATPARSLSRTPGPDPRRLCSPSREIAPKFYTYPFNKVVEEGERVVFKCAVKGLPNPWATWDKDGIIITPTSRITMREKDEILRILEIEEVTIEDVGLYRITLENDYGRAEASARLEVITQKGKFYGGIRSCSASPRRSLYHRRRTPSTSRQD